MIVEYILTSLAVLLIGFIGWFGTAEFLIKYRRLSEKMAFSFGILVFIVSWLAYGLILFFAKFFSAISMLVPVVVLAPFAVKFLPHVSKESKIIIGIFLLQFFLAIFIQLLLPYYPLGSDWFRYYQTSEQYLQGNFATTYGRLPMFNILGAMFLEIFSNHFWVYQVASVFLNSLLIIPLYLIAQHFDKKHAYWTLIFVALNSFVLQNTVYTWPRNFSVFFILFSYYFILKNKMTLSSLTSAAAFFAHISTIFFIIPTYLYGYLARNRSLLKSLLVIVLLISPVLIYYVVNTNALESPETPDAFFLYPFAVNGYESLLNRTSSMVFHDFLSKPFYYPIEVRVVDFVMTITPALAVLKVVAMFVPLPTLILQKTVIISQVPAIYHWLLSYPGALSSLVYVFAVIGMYRLFYSNRNFFWLLMLPLILALLYWGWIKAGIVNDLLQASIPLFIMVAVSQMKSKKWVYLSLALMILEGIVFWYLYVNSIPAFVQSIPTRVPPVADATQLLNIDSINRVLFG